MLLPFFKTGPFDWRGIFVLWIPAIAFTGQFVANTTMLLRAIDNEADELRDRSGTGGGPRRAVPTAA